MPPDAAQPQRAERRQRAIEPRALLFEERRLRIVGGREVRVDGVEPQVSAAEHLRHRPPQVVVPEAEPVHAGIDLQVAAQRDAARRAPRRSSARAAAGVETVGVSRCVEDAVEIADAERAEHQNRAP